MEMAEQPGHWIEMVAARQKKECRLMLTGMNIGRGRMDFPAPQVLVQGAARVSNRK